jgi:hypothetical protein
MRKAENGKLKAGKESMWGGRERKAEKLKTEMLKVRENGKCWGQGKRVCGCGGVGERGKLKN